MNPTVERLDPKTPVGALAWPGALRSTRAPF